MSLLRQLAQVATLLFISSIAYADTVIPPSLTPWIKWVSQEQEFLTCPFINKRAFAKPDAHVCAWSSPLTVDAHNTGAVFAQIWQVYRESFIPLPGGKMQWPRQLKIKALPPTKAETPQVQILSRGNTPGVYLPPGRWQLDGEFDWGVLPQTLEVPRHTQVSSLVVNGDSIPFVAVEEGELWLNAQKSISVNENALSMNVSRKIKDGDVIELTSIVELDISGQNREENLGPVLLDGFVLSGLQSDIPAYIDAEGQLHVKAAAGDYEIRLTAFAPAEMLKWKQTHFSSVWPTEETWSFEAAPALRTGKITGATAIDPRQAYMPEDWYSLPGYQIEQGQTLSYQVEHKGKPHTLKNQLQLNREVWLGFDSQSFQFNDTLSGKMIDDWRLTMSAPFVLDSASDQDGPMLITTEAQSTGVENRYPDTKIEATGHVAKSQFTRITGWDTELERLDMTLNLPPGHRLFSTSGVDKVSSSWRQNWGIWSVFVLLIATVLVARSQGYLTAGCVFFSMLFTLQEPNAPIIWLINLIIATIVYQHQPFDKLKTGCKAYLILSLVIVLGSSLYFAVQQVRSSVYPQLERSHTEVKRAPMAEASLSQIQPPPVTTRARDAQQKQPEQYEVERIEVTGSNIKAVDLLQDKYLLNQIPQTGAGQVNWQWHQYSLRWLSPVTPEQEFSLIILNPWQNAVFKLLGVMLLLATLLLLFKHKILSLLKTPHQGAALLLLPLLLPLQEAEANTFPDAQLRQELKQRLQQAPLCAPECASIQRFTLSEGEGMLNIMLEVNVATRTAIALPRAQHWYLNTLDVDGTNTGVLSYVNGWHYLNLEAGNRKVRLSGHVPDVDSLQFQFNQAPRILDVSSLSHWKAQGVKGSSLATRTLTLARERPQTSSSGTSSRYAYVPVIHIERRFTFDKEWLLTTRVTRLAPESKAINLSLPLISGESVMSADFTVKDGVIELNIPADEDDLSWESRIPVKSLMTLTASKNPHQAEVWSFLVSPQWHIEFEGQPLVIDDLDEQDYFRFEFHPGKGESLKLSASKPKAIAGNTLTFDRVNAELKQGARLESLTLELTYRSTQAQEHLIQLPPEFKLEKVTQDGQRLQLQTDKAQVSLPVKPGQHQLQLTLSRRTSPSFLWHFPRFNLNAPVANISTQIHPGADRWLLWTRGPVMGPAVLYWGECLAFILIALILSRYPFSPLNTVQWLILGLGLSMNNWGILMLIVSWFAALHFSKARPQSLPAHWFNASQGFLYALTGFVIISLVISIPMSLLGHPDMGIQGYDSYNRLLNWYSDRSEGTLSEITVLSLPKLVYQGVMLAWVLWLCFAAIGWGKWAFKRLGHQGYWKAE